MDRQRKKILRSLLFRHLDGLALCGPISALNRLGLTQYIQDHPSFYIQDLLNKFDCNAGYLNVTLRPLASQGWLRQDIIVDGANIHYKLTEKGRNCIKLTHHYDPFSEFIPTLINMDRYLFDPNSQSIQKEFNALIKSLKNFTSQYDDTLSPKWEIGRHLEGMLIGPILVSLGMSEFFLENIENNQTIDTQTIGSEMPVFWSIMDFFQHLGWIINTDDSFRFTPEGIFFMKRSTA